MKTLFLALLLLLPLKKPSATPDFLRHFMREAIEQKRSNLQLADKYFCTPWLHRQDEAGKKARKALEWVLAVQRDTLRAQLVNIDSVKFTPYDALPASEIPAKPFHMLGETSQVYVAQSHGKIILYFLLKNEKIASTLLIGQGAEHYFIDFSH